MPSVGGGKEITDYFKLFDYDIANSRRLIGRHSLGEHSMEILSVSDFAFSWRASS